MSEIFFSYSSHDRERVRPYHDALTALGFDVFWDAQVPTAADWDRMIKGKLEQSRCAIVFWSTNAAASPNVRHEVDIARGDRKLVQVLLEPMSTKALPMGSIAEQAANLADWQGDPAHSEWTKLLRAVEELAAPRWMNWKLEALGLTLRAEQRRVLEADDKVRALTVAHDQEIVAQGDLRRERDRLRNELDELRRRARAMIHQIIAARGLPKVVPKAAPDIGAAKVVHASSGTADATGTEPEDEDFKRRVKLIAIDIKTRMILNIGVALLLAALSYGPHAALKFVFFQSLFQVDLRNRLFGWVPAVDNFCYIALIGSVIFTTRHVVFIARKGSFHEAASVLSLLMLMLYAAPLATYILIYLFAIGVWHEYFYYFYAAIGIAFVAQMTLAISMLIGRKKIAEA